MITFIAHVRVRTEKQAAWREMMNTVVAQTREHEPGVAYYAYSQSADDPERFVVVEVYRDAAAQAAHMASPWVTQSLPVAMRLMEGAPDIQQYVSEGSAPIRATVF